MEIAIENVSDYDMDSLLVKYWVVNGSSNNITEEFNREGPLAANQHMVSNFKFNTACNCLAEANQFWVEINPNNDQPEQFHFNNIASKSFGLNQDITNPLLDVTFDGVHILDGDVVSANPEILIRLKDENKYLALDDTSLVNVFIQRQDAAEPVPTKMNFSSDEVQFIPADPDKLNKDNTAQILINRSFEDDGIYELFVQSQDKSQNASGNYGFVDDGYDYRISFEVINRATITNVMNYPNPFTTRTQFVFTLTGHELPTYFKIQVMTVSGKVVREINLDELGPIHIGRNITEFAWDGTDQYGDPLANGLYLYRVVTSLNGSTIEHRESGADQWFEHGFGKMYMAR